MNLWQIVRPRCWCALALASAGCSAGASELPAGLEAALQARLEAGWQHAALPPALREGLQWQAQFSAPRGAALEPCPEGWELPPVALQRLARVSMPVRCGAARGSVVAQLQVRAAVWALRADTPAGRVLAPQDLLQLLQPVAHVNELLPASTWLGLPLRADGQAGQVLRARDVERPIAVRKGDKVEIRAQGDGVQVSVAGIATASAKLGDTITVRNARTGRPVKGTLIAPGVLQAGSQAPAGALQIRAEESDD
ncbi:MAG: flagellar basal body P-ring formation protein FlgA [Comamonas sp.]|nr:flagellar basal body P-ring formation protein FlgA [Comamonas sp.]